MSPPSTRPDAAPSAAVEARTPSGLRVGIRVIAAIVSILVTIALFRAIRRDGPEALEALRAAEVRWTWIWVSAALGLVGHGALIVGWRRLLVDSGVPATFLQTTRFLLVSNLGRYLPAAKAWQMGIVGIMAAESGLPPTFVAASSLFHGLVGVAVGAILLFTTGGALLGIHPAWSVAAAAGVAALILAPTALRAAPRLWTRLESKMPAIRSVTAGTMWALVWTCALSWLAWGVALYALAEALLQDPGTSVVTYVAAWIGPFLAGVASIVTPAGLGVRDEAMRTILTASGVGAGSAIVVVVVARIWATALEVVPALAFLALRRWPRRGAAAPAKQES